MDIASFGEPTSISGSTYTYACPFCRKEGRDNAGDNLKICIKNNYITCFKSEEHTKALREGFTCDPVVKKRRRKKEELIDLEKEKRLKKYLKQCQKDLLDEHEVFSLSRGLKIETIRELKAGVDLEKQCWVFPVFCYPENVLIGFEYRDIQMLPRKKSGQLWHEKGTFSCLAMINRKPPHSPDKDGNIKKGLIDNIIIVEGFLDAYALYQYIKDKNLYPFQILTPSCGVQSLPKLISEGLQTKCGFTLLLDNDEAGLEARKKIQRRSPYGFFDCYIPKEYNDFGQYYMEVLCK